MLKIIGKIAQFLACLISHWNIQSQYSVTATGK